MDERLDNPLLFDITNIEANLDLAAINLSDSLLDTLPAASVSNMPYLLSERFKKLDHIIKFISQQGLTVNEIAKMNLLFSVEKSLAAVELWNIYDSEKQRNSQVPFILKYAVRKLLKTSSEEDIYMFFAGYVRNIDQLLGLFGVDQLDDSLNSVKVVYDLNRVMYTVLGTTRTYRSQHAKQVYGLDGDQFKVQPWDANMVLVSVLEGFLKVSDRLLNWMSSQIEVQGWKEERELYFGLREQLSGVVDLLVGTFGALVGHIQQKSFQEDLNKIKSAFNGCYRAAITVLGIFVSFILKCVWY